MGSELTLHTGCQGDVTTLHVNWHDHDNVHHEGTVEIVVGNEDKPRRVSVRVDGLPVEGAAATDVIERLKAQDEQIRRCQEENTRLVLKTRALEDAKEPRRLEQLAQEVAHCAKSLRGFTESVPWREAVEGYERAYPGREVESVDVVRWLVGLANVSMQARADRDGLLNAILDGDEVVPLIDGESIYAAAMRIARERNAAAVALVQARVELDGYVGQLKAANDRATEAEGALKVRRLSARKQEEVIVGAQTKITALRGELTRANEQLAAAREALEVAEADYKRAGDERDQLKAWQADVTAALQNPGGARFDEVPGLVRDLVTARVVAVAERDQWEAHYRHDVEVLQRHSLPLHLAAQRHWSVQTFGPGPRTGMVLDHMTKEIAEVRQNPHDVEEWVDLLMLALDGYWRHGGRTLDVTAALTAKLEKNRLRDWPNWRTHDPDKAIEHVREAACPECGKPLMGRPAGCPEHGMVRVPGPTEVPWCAPCGSYHHPANPTCKVLMPCAPGCEQPMVHDGPCDDLAGQQAACGRHGGVHVTTGSPETLLRSRAEWYREGCPHLEEGTDEYKLKHLAEDAADDLTAALDQLGHAKDLLQYVFNEGAIECTAPGQPKAPDHVDVGCCVACKVRRLLTPGWFVRPEPLVKKG